jgi:hypothetical protein
VNITHWSSQDAFRIHTKVLGARAQLARWSCIHCTSFLTKLPAFIKVAGGRRQPWKFCIRGAVGWMYTSPPSLLCVWQRNRQTAKAHSPFRVDDRELRKLVVWLQEFGVEHVAMESTGVYWKPVWNVLESLFQIVLANAQHIKAVPGQHCERTDAESDCAVQPVPASHHLDRAVDRSRALSSWPARTVSSGTCSRNGTIRCDSTPKARRRMSPTCVSRCRASLPAVRIG